MSVRVMTHVFEHAQATGNDRVVLLVLADHASDDGSGAYPSHGTIARKAGGIGERTVRDCLTRLRKAGEIERDGKRGRTVVYRVVMKAAKAAGIDTGGEASSIPADSRRKSGGPLPANHQEPSFEPTPSTSPTRSSENGTGDVARVEAYYVETMNPRRKSLDADGRKIIRDALKVANAEELIICIAACSHSDFHMKRGEYENRNGGKHNSIGKILKPRPRKGETQRSRIDWWLDLAAEQMESISEDSDARGIRQLRAQGLHDEADEMERG